MITKLVDTGNGYLVNDNTFVSKKSIGQAMDAILKYIADGGEYVIENQKDEKTKLVNVPDKVTIRQAKLALLDFGLLDEVDAILQSPNIPRKTKIEWEYANEIERRWVDESGVMKFLGFEKEQLDELFLHASLL